MAGGAPERSAADRSVVWGLADALCESSGRGWRDATCGHCPHRTRELHDASGRVDLGLGARPVVPTIETVEMVPCAGI